MKNPRYDPLGRSLSYSEAAADWTSRNEQYIWPLIHGIQYDLRERLELYCTGKGKKSRRQFGFRIGELVTMDMTKLLDYLNLLQSVIATLELSSLEDKERRVPHKVSLSVLSTLKLSKPTRAYPTLLNAQHLSTEYWKDLEARRSWKNYASSSYQKQWI